MEDLAELADLVTEFAAREHLTIVPAVPQRDYGPEVCLGLAVLDLPRFLDLPRQLGGGVLYLRATPFDPAAVDGDQPEDPPTHLLKTGLRLSTGAHRATLPACRERRVHALRIRVPTGTQVFES
jgi:hypothetical protein